MTRFDLACNGRAYQATFYSYHDKPLRHEPSSRNSEWFHGIGDGMKCFAG